MHPTTARFAVLSRIPLGSAVERLADLARPVLDPLAGKLGYRRENARKRGSDGPSVTSREWSTAFADKLRQGELVAIDGCDLGCGEHGLRALRIVDVRRAEIPTGVFGIGGGEALILLLEDLDADGRYSLPVSPNAAIRMCLDADALDADRVSP